MVFNIGSLAQNRKQLIILIAAFIFFAASITFGIFSGNSHARARADFENVRNVKQALDFYYSDQDSYPSAEQFNTQKVLVPQYLSSMPIVQSKKGACAGFGEYIYTQQRLTDYNLVFCIEKAVEGMPAGIHTLTQEGVQL